jgi:hypothetical protein
VLSVPARGRLVLRGSNGDSAELRALADAPITDLGVIPVLASHAALAIGEGVTELPTVRGVVCVPARLHRDGRLELSVRAPLRPLQRRIDLRGPMELAMRGTLTTRSGRAGLFGLTQRTEFAGGTVDVSAGGLRARLEPSDLPSDAHEFYVELDGSGARPIGAVLEAVALRSGVLQARFVVIAASDREYLVRRLFELERAVRAAEPQWDGRLPRQ